MSVFIIGLKLQNLNCINNYLIEISFTKLFYLERNVFSVLLDVCTSSISMLRSQKKILLIERPTMTIKNFFQILIFDLKRILLVFYSIKMPSFQLQIRHVKLNKVFSSFKILLVTYS